ncbi:MAG: single-stranded-DNA-specific exonuclease RecJ [Pirellulales bacterium]|nr:single-stranded-DNA-specific exonuclease RecJ [Pirellulales bacterium]
MTRKRWRIRPHDSERISQLERATGVSPVVAQMLLCRGIDCPNAAREFLSAKLTSLRDPNDLPGARAAAEAIWQAVKEDRQITIYGDYDVDGISGTSILLQLLKLLGAQVNYYIPNRLSEGYGLNDEALRKLAAGGTQLIVTVDCGIANVEEARTAHELGVQLIVTDHHEFSTDLPEAAALVHPRLPGTDYPFASLCGAGVAFKLAWSLCQVVCGSERVRSDMREFLLQALVFATLGTIADVVPLLDENRILVRHGLVGLKERPSMGLASLMRVMKLDNGRTLKGTDIGFGIGPRINAAGRLGQARLAVELLTTREQARADELAQYLDELNGTRQSLERSILLAANKQAAEEFDPEADPALVLAGRGWHAGVIGIVAGRLAEKYHRPVVLLSLDELGVKPAVGSCRSVPGFNLHQALGECAHHLVGFGGHAAAAGVTIEEKKIDAFRAEFLEVAADRIRAESRVPELHIDAETPLSVLTLKALGQLDQLEPFGQGNARPLLCTTGVRLIGTPRKIGGGERHLKLQLSQYGVNLAGIAFGGGEWAEEIASNGDALAVAYHPMVNHFRGRRSVELEVVDWKPESELAELMTTGAGEQTEGKMAGPETMS